MADYRIIWRNAATGERTSSLSHLGFRVWMQYQLSADDFGVCPALAAKFQGDNDALHKVAGRLVQAEIENLIAVRLCGVFTDGRRRYLYQQDWQDRQRLKHATTTALPSIPAELLAQCSSKTRELFDKFHPKIREGLPPHAGACDASATASAIAYAPANAPEGGAGGNQQRGVAAILSPQAFANLQRFNAYVGARLRVPHKLHGDFVAALGGKAPDADLRAFYAALDAEIETSGEPIVPDIWKWLEARFRPWAKQRADDAEMAKFLSGEVS